MQSVLLKNLVHCIIVVQRARWWQLAILSVRMKMHRLSTTTDVASTTTQRTIAAATTTTLAVASTTTTPDVASTRRPRMSLTRSRMSRMRNLQQGKKSEMNKRSVMRRTTLGPCLQLLALSEPSSRSRWDIASNHDHKAVSHCCLLEIEQVNSSLGTGHLWL